MDFRFFESLTATQAKDYLERFLQVESEAVTKLVLDLLNDGIEADYSIPSIEPVFGWAIESLRWSTAATDSDLPTWITDTPSYASGNFEFDEPSRAIVLRCAYYLGRSFVETIPGLHWSTGPPDRAECNMPIVAGFRHDMGMAVMLITDNLFRRIIADSAPKSEVGRTVDYWADMAGGLP